MTALYVLADEYRAAAEAMADMDMDEQTIADTLEGMAGDLDAKAVNVAMFARNLEATAVAIKEAEGQMAARRRALERRAESLRAYLLMCMQRAGVQRIEAPHFRLALRANPPAVEVFDPAMVPAQYMRMPPPPAPAPDKTAIRAALADGHDVPGCRMADPTVRVEIR